MRSVTRLGAAVAVAAFVGALSAAAPAFAGAPQVRGEPAPVEETPAAGDVIFIEVTPATVEAGYLVGIRASCRDNSVPAIAVSDAFGRVQVQPQRGLLTASPMVHDRTRPGNYRVKLECRGGETASTMLQVVKSVRPTASPTRQPTHPPTHPPTHRPSRGPATGFGGTADSGGLGGLLVPGGLALTVAGVAVGLTARRRPRGTVRR
ncbi:hypothetical protein [Micromonospora mirobrigensis]|uniref:Uncharacterized protein n=1 Tax=Micromonospora mirobrigensis TaxID=262898 RepID=A0A1C4ZAZ5_9ACTN|nr:hypothetical protein [Micromonospora mirobrigensis]SCF29901.1 hypothetical protein GA0070564_105237 [Micromonospora mirobrigensis]